MSDASSNNMGESVSAGSCPRVLLFWGLRDGTGERERERDDGSHCKMNGNDATHFWVPARVLSAMLGTWSIIFGASCLDASTLTFCQLMGFPLNHYKLNF